MTMQETEAKMKKAIESLEHEFTTVRTGKANPTILEKVSAEYYGTPTPINNMANISAPDGRTLVVTPFDKGSLKDIEKAIIDSDLGLTPNNDGNVLRIVMPALTEERRKELVKVVKDYAEKQRIVVRNHRRDALDKSKKDSESTEDDKKRFSDEMQKLTDKYIKVIDEMVSSKEKDVMTV